MLVYNQIASHNIFQGFVLRTQRIGLPIILNLILMIELAFIYINQKQNLNFF